MVDDFSPIYVGDTGATFAPVFQYANGTLYPLSGMSISMSMRNKTGTIKTCSGAWTINTATSVASYAYESTDVDTAGTWTMFIVLTLNGKPVHAQKKTLEILSEASEA